MAAFTVSISALKAAPAKVATRKAGKAVRRATVCRAFGSDDADMLRMELRTLKATVGLKADPSESNRRIAEIEAALSGGAMPAAAPAFGAPAPSSFGAPSAPSAGVPSDSGAYGLEVRCNPTQPDMGKIFPDPYVVAGDFGSSLGSAGASWAPPTDSYSAPEPANWAAPAAPAAPSSWDAPAAYAEPVTGTPEELRMELRTLKATVGLKENPAEANARIAAIEAVLGGAAPAAAAPAAWGAPAYTPPEPASFGAPAAAPSGIPSSLAGLSEDEITMLRCELKSAKATAGLSDNPAEAQARVAALEKLLYSTAY